MPPSQTINILAIESSCDDTAAAVIQNGKILSNIVAGQQVHEAYGGVVPELASRAHQQNIVPLVHQALKRAGVAKEELSAIAFASGPGLIGSLIVGTSFAKSMGLALGIPIIAINHMQAHILAHFIDEPHPPFPFLCLTVSGGHTLITVIHNYFESEVIGQTLDDAAGEAFDKTAKTLGLTYPGGPLVDKHAARGDAARFPFPQPSIPGLDYSFSGLKTSVLYFVRDHHKNDPDFVKNNLNDICAGIQKAIIGHLLNKLEKAAAQTGIRHIAIAGGVSANSGLRNALDAAGGRLGWTTYIPRFEYCTDNAAMIAIAAHYKFLAQDFAPQTISPAARG